MTYFVLQNEIFDSDNIRLLKSQKRGDTVCLIWLELVAYASKNGADGAIERSADELAAILGRSASTVEYALSIFKRFGLLTETDGKTVIADWKDYEDQSGREAYNDYMREYMVEWRKRKSKRSESVNNDVNNALITPLKQENEKESNKEKEKEIGVEGLDNFSASKDIYINNPSPPSTGGRARVPTRDEVYKYISTLKTALDADDFFNYYEAQNWQHNGEDVADWKALARSWARRRPKQAEGNFDTDEMFASAIERGRKLIEDSL